MTLSYIVVWYMIMKYVSRFFIHVWELWRLIFFRPLNDLLHLLSYKLKVSWHRWPWSSSVFKVNVFQIVTCSEGPDWRSRVTDRVSQWWRPAPQMCAGCKKKKKRPEVLADPARPARPHEEHVDFGRAKCRDVLNVAARGMPQMGTWGLGPDVMWSGSGMAGWRSG